MRTSLADDGNDDSKDNDEMMMMMWVFSPLACCSAG